MQVKIYCDMRESAGGLVAIVFNFASYWLRGRREISEPIKSNVH